MRKPIKIAALIIGAVVALLVIFMILVLIFVDPNDYKGTIANTVKQKTGRELTFEGNMNLTFYPFFGIALGPLHLSNAPGFGDKPFASINEAQLGVKVFPLLSGKLEMNKILLDGLELNLARNKNGKTNWDDLLEAEKQQKAEAKSPEPEIEKGETEISEISINGVQIKSASVSWDDKQEDTHYEISDLNLDIGKLQPGKPFDFKLDLQIKSSKPELTIIPALTGTAILDTAGQKYAVENLNLTVTAVGDELPDKEIKASVNTTASADLAQGTLQITGLVIEAMGIKAQGEIHAAKIQTTPSFEGSLKLDEFSPRDTLKKLGVEDMAAKEDALQRASATLAFQGTTSSLNLKTLEIHLDNTIVQGNANVTKFDPPTATFNVTVNTLDLDSYMPSHKEASKTEKPQGGQETPKAGKPDFASLRKLNLKGDVTIGQLKANNLSMRDIKVHVVANNGVLAVDPLTASLYDGSMNAKAGVDVKTDTPKLNLTSEINKVQAGPLLADLMGEERLTGTTIVKVNVTSSGLEAESIKRNLNGKVSFGFYNGAIKGVNIAKMIRDAFNVLKGRPKSADEPLQTDFAELLGSLDITNGVAHNKDLILKSPLLRVNGEGEIDLRDDTLDYLLKAAMVDTLKGQGGASADELLNIPAPIRISGSFQNPQYQLDVKELARALAEGQLKEPLKNVEESIKKQLFGGGQSDGSTSEKPQDMLKKLFK